MLEWGQRVMLCQALLSEMIDLTSPTTNGLEDRLLAINEYIRSNDFRLKDDHSKETESICMLGDVLRDCHDTYSMIASKAMSDHLDENGRKMTMDEAKDELRSQYLMAVKTGDSDVLGMNVNDWINQNMIVIVDKKRRGRKKKTEDE